MSSNKFISKNVKITGSKGVASKVFEGLFMVPVIAGGLIGTAGVIGSSVISGFGFWKSDSYIKYGLDIAAGTKTYTDAMTKWQDALKKADTFFKDHGVSGNLTKNNYNLAMEFINNTFYTNFKFIMGTANTKVFSDFVKDNIANFTVANFGSKIVDKITTDTAIAQNIKDTASALVATFYGTTEAKKGTTGDSVSYTYSSYQNWQIAFGVSTAVAGLMVISVLGYWISRITDRVKTKKDVVALKKISASANDKEIDYVVDKITNRYTLK